MDMARHFLEMDAVLKLLPLCAAVKINTLHIHLTDDQVPLVQTANALARAR